MFAGISTGMWIGMIAGAIGGILGPLIVVLLMPAKPCPDCDAPLSKLRNCWDTPGAVRRCTRCDCRVDLKGKRVKKGTGDSSSSSRKTRKKSRRADDDFDEDDYDDRPIRRGKNAASNTALYWGLGIGGGVLVLIALIAVVIVVVTDDNPPGGIVVQPPGNGNPVPPIPVPPQDPRTQVMGGHFDKPFEDTAPPGGLLVGMDVGLGKFFDLDMVFGVQPIYQTPQGEVRGNRYGDMTRVMTVKAKPGYAVGGITVKTGLIVNGFSATFMRVKGATLDAADRYESPWIGDQTGGGPPTLLGGTGAPIIGVLGKQNAKDCTGLGLLRKL